MSEKTFVHILPEEKYLQYLIKVSEEKKIIYNLLFEDSTVDKRGYAMANLCECYYALYQMEKILEDVEDSFNPNKQEFYVADEMALKFVLLLGSVVAAKESLPLYNVSFSLH